MKRKTILFILIAFGGAIAVGGTYWWQRGDALWVQPPSDIAKRQMMIHDRGSLVMPFDLAKTTHLFNKTPEGGIQQVRAKDPNDREQIALIRSHLKAEQERFAKGDFGDPQPLHGESMPVIAVLKESPGAFTVAYEELADGAQLAYRSSDPRIIDAFHEWFMAQTMDHGL